MRPARVSIARRIRGAIANVAIVAGLFLAAPLGLALMTHRMAPGHVIDAFAETTAPGRARVHVVYEFLVRRDQGSYYQLAHTHGGFWFRPVPDPEYDLATAQARAERLKGRNGRVFFEANDPAESAFITGAGDTWRLPTAMGLLLVALALRLLP